MSSAQKDIIYIDIDDEITNIIEKVRTAEHRIVALVLPKRAAVLQSIVNMKLLKRTGDEAKKHIVLITSETGLLPLAGAVGLHVAKTLQTKPAVPPAPKLMPGVVTVDEAIESTEEPELDASKPVGELAGVPAAEETIELDNSDEPETLKETAKKPANKKLKVPNFDKFRMRLLLGGAGLVLVLILWYLAAFVMPKASITIKTDTQSVTSNLAFSTSPDQKEPDAQKRILPAVVKELKKTDTEKVQATGQKDVGTKASGTITVQNCEDSSSRTLPVGTTFTAGGKNYVSTEAKTVPGSFVKSGAIICGNADVPVAAAENGDSYNRDAGSYSSSSPALQGNFKMNGTAMTGGTTKMVKVVSQQDIDGANTKIQARAGSNPANELSDQFEKDDTFALIDTLITGTPEITSSPKVGEEADEVTVTSTTVYTMTGVKEDQLETLIKNSVKDQFDANKQAIIDYGLDKAVVRATDKQANGAASLNFQSVVVAGAQINQDNLKKEIAGKKRGDTQKLIQALPGVQDVRVDYSPFWVFQTPKKTSKITIHLEKTDTTDGSQ